MIKFSRPILLICGLALLLRLAYALSLPYVPIEGLRGGDSWWYLEHGRLLVLGQVPGSPPSAPLYLIFVGLWQVFLPEAAAFTAIRLTQVMMSAATCYFVYRIARHIHDDERAGLLAAGVIALSPVFIIESGQYLTETLYIFLLAGGLLAYLDSLKNPSYRPYRAMIVVGLLLGLATLTRAVLLVFPLGLAFHLLLVCGLRSGAKRAAVLLAVYLPVVLIWTVYNRVVWNQWVVGAQGLVSFLYIGASESGWENPDAVDDRLAEETGAPLPSDPAEQQQLYGDAASSIISSDIGAYLWRRVSDLADAYLQPHGTIFFPGESLKALTADWFTNDRTLSGLSRLAVGDAFWPKLAVYVLHYAGIAAGILGMWLSRREWRFSLPLIGFILYTTLIHLALDAIPRYIFPTTVIWWVFAGIALVTVWDKIAFSNRLKLRQKFHSVG